MSEEPKARSRLIDDTLNEGWESGPAAEFARRAAAQVRRRRSLQRTLLGGGALAGGILAVVLANHRPASINPGIQVAHATPGYEIISEEQLLAAWGDRPVLILPAESLERRLVLLNR